LTLFAVMLGAALGAPSRWLLDQAIQSGRDRVFPLGTWTINVSGSLVLGIVLGASAFGPGSAALVAFAGAGFCGGFTTFSTFGFETVRLVEEGSQLEAVLNVASSVVVGLDAALAGWFLARGLWG
jgi:CrcB protein